MIYSFAIRLYAFAVRLAALFNVKARLMLEGQRKTFATLRGKIRPEDSCVWFHAASLGEFEQGRPLMELLRQRRPQYKIVLTFFSPSGYEVRKNYKGADVVCYLPFDTPSNAHKFIKLVHPRAAFFIKYEFWYNYLCVCKERGIETLSVSSIFRPHQRFFKWYGRWARRVLRCFTYFFVQDECSRRLLARIGLNNVTVSGDTRFDRVCEIARGAKDLPLAAGLADGHLTLVAGSTWERDEDLLIPYFNEHPEVRLILAPHVVSERRLREIEGRLRRSFVRYSEAAERGCSAECLIIDCYGLLSSVYRYADVAYVGGGFGVGIHNVLEAAVYGVPVVIGPNNKKFREAQDLLHLGGCIEVRDVGELKKVLDSLFGDGVLLAKRGRIAGDYIAKHGGASKIIMERVRL